MLDLSINLKMVEQNCPLTQTSSVGGAISSNNADLQPLGQLDSLPLEIFQNILEQLDLHTLILVQCLSHRSKLLVSSLPQYRNILAYAPNALRAILSTGLASQFQYRNSLQRIALPTVFHVWLIWRLPIPTLMPPMLLAMSR